ncbi:unnamed protein product [Spirodela intermedia]|uniref:non-specific serine/threonine protein kinase n=1 Tax=Spirodela intermedia TaxID=51605 RepID=A0A7I8JT18_SPIIN|nr:unnamed protein product [Spirodela intermedia]CAA6672891.1 unnamed protein product [Spirodela intermedia]
MIIVHRFSSISQWPACVLIYVFFFLFPADTYQGQQQSWQQTIPPPAPQVLKIPPPAYASRPPNSPPRPVSVPVTASSGGSSGPEDPLLFSPSPGPSLGGFSKSSFTYEELVVATDGFTDSNLLGQGGFGYVHRGMLPNGKEVAVKQLKVGSGRENVNFRQRSKSSQSCASQALVSLVGYCITGEKRLLVYEFVPNNTLEFHLHGKGRPVLEWSTRLKIALGSAKGLAYLHEDCHPKIIHRDIKASNILLDYKFEAKENLKSKSEMTEEENTKNYLEHLYPLYLAPEYAASGKLTDKSDVFSFGVMLLELITGRRPVDSANAFMDDSLVDWARPLLTRALEDGNYEALVDHRLENNYDPNEMTRLVACAAACVRHSARRRPRMSQIVRVLEGDVSLEDLNEGVMPGHSSMYGSSTDYDRGQYSEDMRSEYSAPTSQYGMNPSVSSSEGYPYRDESGRTKKDSRDFSG